MIFDVKAVFLFPWAAIFEDLGYQAVVEMAVFIGILAVGILYAWRKECSDGPDHRGRPRSPGSSR